MLIGGGYIHRRIVRLAWGIQRFGAVLASFDFWVLRSLPKCLPKRPIEDIIGQENGLVKRALRLSVSFQNGTILTMQHWGCILYSCHVLAWMSFMHLPKSMMAWSRRKKRAPWESRTPCSFGSRSVAGWSE